MFANRSARRLADEQATKVHSFGALKKYFPEDYGDLVALAARGQGSISNTEAETARWTQSFLASHAQQEAAAPAEALAAEMTAFAALVSQLQHDNLPTCAAMGRNGANSEVELSPLAQDLADRVTETRIVAAYRGSKTPVIHDDPSEADTEHLRRNMEELMPGSYDRLAGLGSAASDAETCGTAVAFYHAISTLDPGAQARFVRRKRLLTSH